MNGFWKTTIGFTCWFWRRSPRIDNQLSQIRVTGGVAHRTSWASPRVHLKYNIHTIQFNSQKLFEFFFFLINYLRRRSSKRGSSRGSNRHTPSIRRRLSSSRRSKKVSRWFHLWRNNPINPINLVRPMKVQSSNQQVKRNKSTVFHSNSGNWN